jgi:hypothetical protein
MDEETNNGDVNDNNDDDNNNDWNVKTNFLPVINGTAGSILNPLGKYPNNIPGKHDIKELQKTAWVHGTDL